MIEEELKQKLEQRLEQKRIHQLPVYLANQIAAGEVVERPASVLKELLENSLDAKSTEIEITVERGGTKLIQVQDNGLGIYKDDLSLAIASHATSKIANLSDLEGVKSYGFRGEALASISSVSRLELISAVEDQSCGWSIQLEGRDKPPTLQPVAKHRGTLIAVRDLFYNTPARLKFLKSEKTEAAYLEEIFKRIALSQPAVAFKFQQGEGIQKRLPICRSLEAHIRRVAQLCGKRFIEEAYYIEAEANGLKLTGWLGSENAMRSQADLQYFYVNGRIVRDKIVMHAVRQAYQSVNSLGRFPAYVLYFECDAFAVDVNVHPTKHEVRFREARTVHAFLSYAIHEGLKQANPNKTRDIVEKADDKPQFSFLEMERDAKFPLSPADVNANVHQAQQDKPQFLFKGEFLWIENAQGGLLVDVKAAYRVYLRQVLSEEYQTGGVTQRPLLMPKSIRVNNGIDIESNILDWGHLGFELTGGGHNLVLVRAVPRVLGSEIENLNLLLNKLLSQRTVEHCIGLLVDTVIQNQTLMEDAHQMLLRELQNPRFLDENEKKTFHKQLTLEQFRSIFF
ncbi:MAG TPA: DNA mismatch repair endonuclease MutL [Gammaproteobacteria bacterium]|nr:DNA mismatch repair endonuclease MutL [Gammaproteobacteria bacterium]